MALADDPSAPPAPASPERIARSAGLAGIATLTSRVLGVARESVLAAYFGAGNEYDAFLVAFRVPTLMRDLFAEGAMSAAFVPTFTRHLTLHGKEPAWRLGNNVLNALVLVTGTLVLLAWIFATPLVSWFAPDYATVPGKLELTILLARIMVPFLILVALAAAAMGMLNSLRHYFRPALSPAMFNVASIICTIALTPLMPWFGWPRIVAPAIGVLAGGLGQILLQWPPLRGEGFRYVPHLQLRDPAMRQMLLLMGPGTLGLAATQVNLLVNTQLAAGEGPGAVSWLGFAFRIMYLPIGLFGVSIGTAVLPAVSRQMAGADMQSVGATVTRGVALMLVVTLPATVGLMLLAEPIVQLLLERGRFFASDTLATATALRCYAVGLVGYSTARIASPIFYALGRSRLAVMVAVTAITANLGFSLTLTRTMGFAGLALATSLAALVNGGLALALLQRQIGTIDTRDLVVTTVKALLATAAMALVIWWLAPIVAGVLPGAVLWRQALRLLALIGSGLIALAAAAALLRLRELATFTSAARRQIDRRLRR